MIMYYGFPQVVSQATCNLFHLIAPSMRGGAARGAWDLQSSRKKAVPGNVDFPPWRSTLPTSSPPCWPKPRAMQCKGAKQGAARARTFSTALGSRGRSGGTPKQVAVAREALTWLSMLRAAVNWGGTVGEGLCWRTPASLVPARTISCASERPFTPLLERLMCGWCMHE